MQMCLIQVRRKKSETPVTTGGNKNSLIWLRYFVTHLKQVTALSLKYIGL
jgi:hypothetical protein